MRGVQHRNYYTTLSKAPLKGNLWWLYKGSRVKLLLLLLAASLISCSQKNTSADFEFREGDIILQSLNSTQCQAVREATDSYYTHCGIVLKDNNELIVYEAIGPVKKTNLKEFTRSGINSHFVVLRHESVDTSATNDMIRYCRKELGKPYDLFFNWDDSEIYCSELVWKAYQAGGIKLCSLRPLKDYDLSSSAVQSIMRQRYGEKIPKDEPMIAPSDLFSSPLLIKVYENKK